MSGLFAFGTLRHLPLLEAVIGRGADTLEIVPARLPGHAVRAVAGEDFPRLEHAEGEAAEGLLIRRLTREDWARIDFYENGFNYDLHGVRVETDSGEEPARAYFTDDDRLRSAGPWQLQTWVDRWGELTPRAAAEKMRLFGHVTPQAAGELRFAFRARAWARMLAREPAPQTRRSTMGLDDVTHFEEHDGYTGFFRLAVFDIAHRRFRGGETEPVRREAFVAFDAAIVLPYDPERDRVLLVEQFRYGPLMRGDPAPWVLEPVAGLVDAREDPAETARREALEEAHLELRSLEPMPNLYPSPGYSSEFFHCFLGLCDLPDRGNGHAGLDAENEDIRTHVLAFDEAMDLLDSGEINVGITATMLLWLARYRARRHGPA
ncbi:NUDIX domain-containing protein [Roseivivax sp. CAU 1761]